MVAVEAVAIASEGPPTTPTSDETTTDDLEEADDEEDEMDDEEDEMDEEVDGRRSAERGVVNDEGLRLTGTGTLFVVMELLIQPLRGVVVLVEDEDEGDARTGVPEEDGESGDE